LFTPSAKPVAGSHGTELVLGLNCPFFLWGSNDGEILVRSHARAHLNERKLVFDQRTENPTPFKPLVRGATCEPPFDPEASHGVAVREQGSLHPGCFFPITDPRTRVKAPCVFSGTGWVARALMVREFAACCDTQESMVKTLLDIPVTKVAMTDIPFSVNPPAKVLGAFLHLISPQKGGRPENEATSAAGLGNMSDIGLSTCGGL
jgi:hypothetical protein